MPCIEDFPIWRIPVHSHEALLRAHVFYTYSEILQSLQCKIFQYTFLGKYPMKFQNFFSLCQIQQLAWLRPNHRQLGPSEMRLLSDPCLLKLKMKKKNTLSCRIHCFEKVSRVSVESYMHQDCLSFIYFIFNNFLNLCLW